MFLILTVGMHPEPGFAAGLAGASGRHAGPGLPRGPLPQHSSSTEGCCAAAWTHPGSTREQQHGSGPARAQLQGEWGWGTVRDPESCQNAESD